LNNTGSLHTAKEFHQAINTVKRLRRSITMAMIRFNPFREMESMQRQMNRLFDEMMSYGTSGESGVSSVESFNFVPAAEIQETPEQIKLKMELPGIDPKDLDVKVTAEAVAIRGERKSEVQRDDKGIHRSEFRYGSFQRVIPLPSRIQNNQVKAEFQHGVLCLTMPKAEEEKNRVVTVDLLNGQTNGSNGQAQPNGQPQSNGTTSLSDLPQGQESQAPQAT
jgi:HSP20 family protein